MPEPAADASSLLSRILDPAAPAPLRLAAARGALPLGRQDLISALVHLAADPDAKVAGEASKTLAGSPVDVVLDVVCEADTSPAVLVYFARQPAAPEAILISIIVHPATPDDVLIELASGSEPSVLERMVANETRLVRNPAIAEKLKANPALPRDARRRLRELEQHLLGGTGIAFGPVSPSGGEGTAVSPPAEATPASEAGGGEVPAPMLEIPLTPEEQAAEAALKETPLYQRILRMNVSERIQTALKGGGEERAILIRDPSRLVATTVLKSPKLNDREIEGFANLRNVNDEVLRIIGTHQNWTKHYGVAHALARNPRTPTGISLTMLNRLVNRDLKNLGSDKNIPEVIRRSAKRLYDLHTKPPEQKGKKRN